MKIVVWGAGGHGGVVLDAVRQQAKYEPVAFLDDGRDSGERHHRSGLPILYGRHHLSRLRADGVEGIVIAIGDVYIRSKLARVAADAGFEWCPIIHPSAIIATDVSIEKGTVVLAGSVVQTGGHIGDNVLINMGTCIDHDCRIGHGAHVAPGVAVAGAVSLGDFTNVGIGATISDHLKIGRNCLIGAGAVVVRDIPDHSVAYGVPARVVRQQDPA